MNQPRYYATKMHYCTAKVRYCTAKVWKGGRLLRVAAVVWAVVWVGAGIGNSIVSAATLTPTLPPLMTPEIVAAVDRGLSFLVKMQQPDGSFSAKWNGRAYPATMTSFAGLAMLASGSTPEAGPYAPQLRKAMNFLLDLAQAHPEGLIAGPQEMRSTYGHGYAMLFLAQCYGMEQTKENEERIRKVLEKCIEICARGQSRSGGWLYNPIGGGDEGSTTACILQGLRACRNVGLKVPPETIANAVRYLKDCQNPDGGICYSMAHRGASRLAISAAAVTCFYSLGIYDQQEDADGMETAMVHKLWRYLALNAKNVEEIKGHFCYYHFYMAQAQYQRGGREWELYYKDISRELLRMQGLNGSWPGDDVGPTYGTAIACFILQLPYGFLPICER